MTQATSGARRHAARSRLGAVINKGLGAVGLELRRRRVRPADGEGFPSYFEAASRAGVDVNDWIESDLGWSPALPVLQATTRAHCSPTSVVIELGCGTGRWSRHLLQWIPAGQLHLVDHSVWVVDWLTTYFASAPNVHVHLCNGRSIPSAVPEGADLIFSDGTLIELKLGEIWCYAVEFSRLLRRGGHAVFDFIDIGREEGWQYLETTAAALGNCYTYHEQDVIVRVFEEHGFSLASEYPLGPFIYLDFERQ